MYIPFKCQFFLYMFQIRLVIAEKGLPCEERDVSLPLAEQKEPWFMRLNLGEEIPVVIHGDHIISDYNKIIDYVESNFVGGNLVHQPPDPEEAQPIPCHF